jgi:hypothetical protein
MQSDDKIKGNDKASAHRLTKSAASGGSSGRAQRGEDIAILTLFDSPHPPPLFLSRSHDASRHFLS